MGICYSNSCFYSYVQFWLWFTRYLVTTNITHIVKIHTVPLFTHFRYDDFLRIGRTGRKEKAVIKQYQYTRHFVIPFAKLLT